MDHEGDMHRLALPTVLTFLVATAIGSSAWAHAIVVVRPDASDAMLTEAFSRLCGELHMYGLNVNLADGEDGASSSDKQLAEIGRSADVVGRVALLRTAGQASAKIWITEAATGRESVRITVSINDADAPSLLAIRAVDLLRASLRDVDHPENAQPPRPPGAAPDVPSTMRAAPAATVQGFGRWAIRGGASTLWETGALGVGFAANVGLARRISPRLALELSVVVPVIGQAYAGTAATARLREELGDSVGRVAAGRETASDSRYRSGLRGRVSFRPRRSPVTVAWAKLFRLGRRFIDRGLRRASPVRACRRGRLAGCRVSLAPAGA